MHVFMQKLFAIIKSAQSLHYVFQLINSEICNEYDAGMFLLQAQEASFIYSRICFKETEGERNIKKLS